MVNLRRFDGGVLAAAEGSQLHTAHQPPGLEDVSTLISIAGMGDSTVSWRWIEGIQHDEY
jgi:hypothetical protein